MINVYRATIPVLTSDKEKLDRVGPVDNRPSINYLNHLVKKKIKKITTRNTRDMTCDSGQVTYDTKKKF